jgi:succinyl-diaminopimelate desuccinylase
MKYVSINWIEEVLKRQEAMIKDTQELLQIKSVLDEESAGEGAPFGKGINDALTLLLEKGKNDGFTVKNLNGMAAHLEYGQGDELIGILCHIDVVPEGDGWSSDPYGAEIRDGKIFARGAMDDKGPTMAAYYGLKIVKELGLPVNKRVRIILGTDEESHWRCVKHYFDHEEMPTMGFAPDADFPIINAEKGIFDFEWLQKNGGDVKSEADFNLVSLQSGRRLNMVPDHAEATLEVLAGQTEEVVEAFELFLQKNEVTGNINLEGNHITLQMEGISAHGSTPERGINAGLHLVKMLSGITFGVQASEFIGFVSSKLATDFHGEEIDIAFSDDVSGKLTLNVGTLRFDSETGGKIGVNIRYPVTLDSDTLLKRLKSAGETAEFDLKELEHLRSLYVDEDHELIKKLTKVYEEQTGEKSELLSIGGGTYARSLEAGVAFGAQFPGRPDVAHQKDEFIDIEDMLKATAIYAQAIYELAK